MMSLTSTFFPLLLVLYLVRRLYYCRFEQFAQWPQLKPSLFGGHLGHIQEIVSRSPPDRHIDYVFQEISERLGRPPAFVLDLRPVAAPLCVISSHILAEQVSKKSKKYPYSLPKTAIDSSYAALLGRRSLLTMQGEEWRRMRQKLNPAFSKGYLMTLMPCIIEHISPFLKCLDRYARSGADFPLQEPLAELTLSIMGSIIFGGSDNNSPEMARPHEITFAFRELYSTYSFDPNLPSWFIDPRVKWRRNQVEKKLTNLMRDYIHKSFHEPNRGTAESSIKYLNPRSVLALALNDVENMTTEVLDLVCDQVKFLLFAGFDTTIYLLAWLFYELSITPRALKAVRDELDDIFGQDADPYTAKAKLLSNPADILSRMPYASALIKETLRLHPPGATSRTVASGSGAFLRMPDGGEVCMDGLSFYSCHSSIHREEEVYQNTKDTFLPERWLSPLQASTQVIHELGKPDASSFSCTRVPPGAWRPFERGPRDCLGKELGLLIPNIVLVFAARSYDFSKTGLGQVARDECDEPVLNPSGQYEVRSQLYNARQFIPKPVDGMRMRVSLR